MTHIGSGSASRNSPSANAWPAVGGNVFLVVQSFFILVCGFYTTWRWKGTFASLLLILPISIVPFYVIGAVSSLRKWETLPSTTSSAEPILVTYTIMIIAIVLLTWLAYRAAKRTLGPTEPEYQSDADPSAWTQPWRPSQVNSLSREPYRFSITSLLWQSVHHSRSTLLGIATMIVAGTIAGSLLTQQVWPKSHDLDLAALTLVGLIGVSWLGVFAFTGDGSAHRLRFLADRGASPTVVWIRQTFGGTEHRCISDPFVFGG